MVTTQMDNLSVQLERLRGLYLLLASVPDSRQHDELIDRTRLAIADVRRTRAMMAATSRTVTMPEACR